MHEGRVILSSKPFQMVLDRLCLQLLERYDDFSGTCLLGIQPRGIWLADRLHSRLSALESQLLLKYGKLDITFYRDDFHLHKDPLIASDTQIDFPIEGCKVILVDDVLYTGRTIQAAMSALNDLGRPAEVSLLTLVDRRFNRHLPIKADYIGIVVDAVDEAYVRVCWKGKDEDDGILLFPQRLSVAT